MNTATNTHPHEYFLHLFGEELLDVLIVETPILEAKVISKGHFESFDRWKPINHKELSVFLGITTSIGLNEKHESFRIFPKVSPTLF